MKRNIYIIAIVQLVLILASCSDQNSQKLTEGLVNDPKADNLIQISQAQFDKSDMKLGGFEQKQFPSIVSVNGMIDVPPENRADVNAILGGYVKQTHLLVGDKVKKGDVLVTLENPLFVNLQQKFMEIDGQLAYLKAEYERQKTMKVENITSEKSYLKSQSDYQKARAEHSGLQKQLEMLNIDTSKLRSGSITSVVQIFAPISGSITKVNVTKGSFVSQASPMFEIIDNDHIHLELSVFEKDVMKIKKGQKINFTIPESSEEVFKAQVHLVGTSIQSNRTIKVHGHLENESKNNLYTGMFVIADIIVDSQKAKALPSESIVKVDNKLQVLILDKKENGIYFFKPVEVNVIASYDGFSELAKPEVFNYGIQFLTKGAFGLIGE